MSSLSRAPRSPGSARTRPLRYQIACFSSLIRTGTSRNPVTCGKAMKNDVWLPLGGQSWQRADTAFVVCRAGSTPLFFFLVITLEPRVQ